MPDGDNHVLNGILFEIYFDSHGEFREGGLKRHYFDEVMALSRLPEYTKSFSFIRTVLSPYRGKIICFIPEEGDGKIDVDITSYETKTINSIGDEEICSIICMVAVNGMDITERVRRRFSIYGVDLIEAIAIVCKAPRTAISLHVNMALQGKIAFEKMEGDDPFAI